MRAPALAVSFVAACSGFPEPSRELACSQPTDCPSGRTCEAGYCVVSEVDAAMPDAPDAAPVFDCSVWSATRYFQPCDLPEPSAALDLASGLYRYDTTTGTFTAPDGATSMPANKLVAAGRALSVSALTVGASASLIVLGDRPLLIASWSRIDVQGTIDVGSTTLAGPGANPPECATHAAGVAQDNGDGASGGGGGGFQGVGGRGGSGDAGAPGNGGTAVSVPMLRGGCSGGRGGNGDLPGGAGGLGGGAIQLTARIAISIAGRVTAGGAGGGGASQDGGGGGGGSGGMIGLEAPAVALVAGAMLAANGGGGGQGSNVAVGGRGQDGFATLVRSIGGAGGDGGGGGLGSGGTTLGGNQGQNHSDHGAGGGGGAAGFVVISSAQPMLAGDCSPAATMMP